MVYSEPTVILPHHPKTLHSHLVPNLRKKLMFIIPTVHHLPSRCTLHYARAARRRRLAEFVSISLKVPIATVHAMCDHFFKDGWTLWPHELIQIVVSTPVKSIPTWIMTCFLLLCDFSPSFPAFNHSEELWRHSVYLWLVLQSDYLFL